VEQQLFAAEQTLKATNAAVAAIESPEAFKAFMKKVKKATEDVLELTKYLNGDQDMVPWLLQVEDGSRLQAVREIQRTIQKLDNN
jgi:hypothetical protein